MTSIALKQPKYGPLMDKAAYAKWAKSHPGTELSHQGYVNWVTKTRGNRQLKRAGVGYGTGLTMTPYATALGQANALYPAAPAPLQGSTLRTMAANQVQAAIDPVIKQITDSINARSKEGSAAIQGYTNTYANRVASVQDVTKDIYNTAEHQQANANAALTNFIQGRGAQLGSELAAAGSDSGQAALSGLGQGAAVSDAALGSSDLANLIATGAAEKSYAAKLPGFARGMGQLELGTFQKGLGQELADKTGQLTAQVPGLVQQTYQSLLDRELNKSQMAQTRAGNIADYVSGVMNRNATLAGLSLTAQNQAAGTSLGWYNADTARQNAAGGATTPGGLTANQLASLRSSTYSSALNFAQQLASAHLIPGTQTPRKGAHVAQYNEVQRQVYEQLKGALSGYMTDAQIRAMARQATNAAGLFQGIDPSTGKPYAEPTRNTAASPAKPTKPSTSKPHTGKGGTPQPAGPPPRTDQPGGTSGVWPPGQSAIHHVPGAGSVDMTPHVAPGQPHTYKDKDGRRFTWP